MKNGRVVGGMPQAVDAYVSGKSYYLLQKYQLKCEHRFIIYTKDLKYQDGIMYIPIYMTMLL